MIHIYDTYFVYNYMYLYMFIYIFIYILIKNFVTGMELIFWGINIFS